MYLWGSVYQASVFTGVSLVPTAYFYYVCVLLPILLTWKIVSSTCWLRFVLGVGYWTLALVDESDADCGVGRNFAQVMHNMAERFYWDRFKTAAGFLFWALLGLSHAPFWLLHLLQEWAWKEWKKKCKDFLPLILNTLGIAVFCWWCRKWC